MEKELEKLIHEALKEDVYDKDVTSLSIIETKREGIANLIVKSSGVVSGTQIAKEVFRQISPKIKFNILKRDGEYVHKGDVIASISGRMIDIIRGERVALNFLQRMSGIATLTDKYVEELKGTNCQILDTRKTTPLLREFEKEAVVHGKGLNNRFNLSEQASIKDYHIAIAGSVEEAVKRVRTKYGDELIIEVEVTNKDQYLEALESDCDVIRIDNLSNDELNELCMISHDGKKLIASGNITINKIRSIALLGVDYISIDSLVHSAKALDIDFKFLKKSYK